MDGTGPDRAVGIDGTSRGWVAVELRGGRFRQAWMSATLAGVLSQAPHDRPIGVDMPLGLVERGWRTADLAARSRLGVRRSTIFVVPPRPVWLAESLAEANRLCRQWTGGGFSAQAWGLRAKLLEADAIYNAEGAGSAARLDLREIHPELVFARLAGAPVAYPKKTWNGQMIRRSLLAAVGVRLPDDLGPAGGVPVDDVLDAAAVAWSAARIGSGQAEHLPVPPDQFDHCGRPIVIWT